MWFWIMLLIFGGAGGDGEYGNGYEDGYEDGHHEYEDGGFEE